MAYLNLPPELVTGLDLIDRDHDRLFELVALFRQAKEVRTLGLLKTVVTGLVEYAEYHFKKEEIGFEAAGYAESDSHAAEHRALERTVFQLQADLDRGPEVFTPDKLTEIDAFLVDWLNHHIAISDMAYRETIIASEAAIEAMAAYSFAHHMTDAAVTTDPVGDILGDQGGP